MFNKSITKGEKEDWKRMVRSRAKRLLLWRSEPKENKAHRKVSMYDMDLVEH